VKVLEVLTDFGTNVESDASFGLGFELMEGGENPLEDDAA
jgi:hypothetical protein